MGIPRELRTLSLQINTATWSPDNRLRINDPPFSITDADAVIASTGTNIGLQIVQSTGASGAFWATTRETGEQVWLINAAGQLVGADSTGDTPPKLLIYTPPTIDPFAAVQIASRTISEKGLVLQRISLTQTSNLLEGQDELGTPLSFISAKNEIGAQAFYMLEPGGSNSIRVSAPSGVSPYSIELPNTPPAADGQFLAVNIAGDSYWTDPIATSLVWSDLADPVANLVLNMANYTTAFVWGDATGSSDMFHLRDAPLNTGTGAILAIDTSLSSQALGFRVGIRSLNGLRVGWSTPSNYSSVAVGQSTLPFSSIRGILSFGDSGNRERAITLNDDPTAMSGLGWLAHDLRVFSPYTASGRVSLGSVDGVGTYRPGLQLDLLTQIANWRSGYETRYFDTTDSRYVGLRPPTVVTTSYSLTFPPAPPTLAGSILQSDPSGNLTWSSGSSIVRWSDLLNPAGNLSLTHGSFTTLFQWGAATGSSDLFGLTDSPGNTGTGHLLTVHSRAGSNLTSVLTARVQDQDALRVGWSATSSQPAILVGETTATFTDIAGILSFGDGSNDRSLALLLEDSSSNRTGLGFDGTELRLFTREANGTITLGGYDTTSSTYIAYAELYPAGNYFGLRDATALRLFDSGSISFMELVAPNVTSPYQWQMPPALPTSDYSVCQVDTGGLSVFTPTPRLERVLFDTWAYGTESRIQIGNLSAPHNDQTMVAVRCATSSVRGITVQTAGILSNNDAFVAVDTFGVVTGRFRVSSGWRILGNYGWMDSLGATLGTIGHAGDGTFVFSSSTPPAAERIILGDNTAVSPSIQRSSQSLWVRLGDDSDFTTVRAAGYETATANGAVAGILSISENIVLSTGSPNTFSVANLLPANSLILAVVARITTTITGAANWRLGDAALATRFLSPTTSLTAGTTVVGVNHQQGSVNTNAAGQVQLTAAPIRINLNTTPTGGAIRVTVFYLQLTPPTS